MDIRLRTALTLFVGVFGITATASNAVAQAVYRVRIVNKADVAVSIALIKQDLSQQPPVTNVDAGTTKIMENILGVPRVVAVFDAFQGDALACTTFDFHGKNVTLTITGDASSGYKIAVSRFADPKPARDKDDDD